LAALGPAGGAGDLGAGNEIVRRNPTTILTPAPRRCSGRSITERWIDGWVVTSGAEGRVLKGKWGVAEWDSGEGMGWNARGRRQPGRRQPWKEAWIERTAARI
jgi:hypothetical protein